MRDPSKLIKAYDVRAVVPDEFDEGLSPDIGTVFACLVDSPAVVIVRDMRRYQLAKTPEVLALIRD